MRSISLAALILLILAFSTKAVSGQGKDKDKDKDKESMIKKDPGGKYPTEISGKDLDKWILEIKDSDPVNRQTAIQTVVQFGPAAQKALTVLTNRLYVTSESDYAVRADAAVAIYMLGISGQDTKTQELVITSLIQAVDDAQRPVRLQAITALGRIGYDAKKAIAKLGIPLRDPYSWQERLAAVHALSTIGRSDKGADAAAVSLMLEALVDKSLMVRMEAVNGLSLLGPVQDEKVAAAEKTALERRLVEEKDHRAKVWVRVLLMLMDEKKYMTTANLSLLVKELDGDDPKLRAVAAQSLGTLGKHAKGYINKLMGTVDNDPNQDVQLAAISALTRIGDPACVPFLIKRLKNDEEPTAVRVQIMTVAPSLGAAGRPFVNEIAALLAHKDPELVAAAINSLSAFADLAQPAIPDLKKLAESGVVGLADKNKTDFLKDATDHTMKTDKALKDAATEAARHINDAKPRKN